MSEGGGIVSSAERIPWSDEPQLFFADKR